MSKVRRWGAAFALAVVGVPCSYARDLTFDERVQAQEAIERIYYSHQIGTTKTFEQAVPRAVLESRVQLYLAQSVALKKYWRTPITTESLRGELERMTGGTQMPERLRELFAALEDAPALIQECLARPVLVDRLVRNFFAYDDRFHGATRGEAETLREALQEGWIDPWTDHPQRSVVDVAVVDSRSSGGSKALQSGVVLELEPEDYERERARAPEGIGAVSSVREEHEGFVVSVLLEEEPHRYRVARFAVSKRSYEAWWSEVVGDLEQGSIATVRSALDPIPGFVEDLAKKAVLRERTSNGDQGPAAAPCFADDTWDNGVFDDPPYYASIHRAVWTGSVMLVWGSKGQRYDPATDSWALISSENAPLFRVPQTAVWTGGVMVVWGGYNENGDPATGGRYDPVSNTWASTSVVDVPASRQHHSAVWTGEHMVVWGGCQTDGVCSAPFENSGGRYDPETDTWTPTSLVDAPLPRIYHSAVWTGSEVVVWGGVTIGAVLNTGGRYDPLADTWTPTSLLGAPRGRYVHSAVWTGSSMVVWGGVDAQGSPESTGGLYDPAADSWAPMSVTGAPTPRYYQTAVWTGERIVVWGGLAIGDPDGANTGGRYDPVTDSWTPTSLTNAPDPRYQHTAIWTGSLMIVWGGRRDSPTIRYESGGRYDPATDTWTPTYWTNRPEARELHTMVWTGNRMIVWGGRGTGAARINTGGFYDLVTDTWTPTSTIDAPSGRFNHTAVWAGTSMVVWGGVDNGGETDTGGRYTPLSDTWTPTSTANTPVSRQDHTAVWTGDLMIVWGGRVSIQTDNGLNTGGRYDPETDTWLETSTVHVPGGRHTHTAVWTGDRMIVWGGRDFFNTGLDTGGRYDPATDSWLPPPTKVNAPTAREEHTAVWSGDEMIVWGGSDGDLPLASGGRYNPGTNTWVATSMRGAPTARVRHTVVWTGDEMIVWGGYGTGPLATGGRYNPVMDAWLTTSMTDAPPARYEHTSVWTGGFMIVWGGDNQNTGGRYALGHSVDNDGDGVSECDGDCNDGNPEVLPGALEICDGLDNDCSGAADDLDADQDESTICEDCNDGDATTYPDAPEVNDGVDNQCPGDAGYGVTDETSSESGFHNPADKNEYSWPEQPGALSYEVARADVTDFSAGCTMFGPMPETFLVDADPLASGELRFYMNRSSSPNLGSWGQDSSGQERDVPCD